MSDNALPNGTMNFSPFLNTMARAPSFARPPQHFDLRDVAVAAPARHGLSSVIEFSLVSPRGRRAVVELPVERCAAIARAMERHIVDGLPFELSELPSAPTRGASVRAPWTRRALDELRWLRSYLLEQHGTHAQTPAGRSLQRLVQLLDEAGPMSARSEGSAPVLGFALVENLAADQPRIVHFFPTEWEAVTHQRLRPGGAPPCRVVPATVRLGVPE